MPIFTPLPEGCLAVKDLAARWGVTGATVRNWIARGLIHAARERGGFRRYYVTQRAAKAFEAKWIKGRA